MRARDEYVNDIELARALHVLSIVFWIGGVGFVTTVLLPHVRRTRPPEDRLRYLEEFERRFAVQARGFVLLVGLTGLYMVMRLGLWPAFRISAYWWLHAMVVLWAIYAFMLFVAEPIFLNRWLKSCAKVSPESTFRFVERLHWLLMTLSAITVLAAVAGAHGWL